MLTKIECLKKLIESVETFQCSIQSLVPDFMASFLSLDSSSSSELIENYSNSKEIIDSLFNIHRSNSRLINGYNIYLSELESKEVPPPEYIDIDSHN